MKIKRIRRHFFVFIALPLLVSAILYSLCEISTVDAHSASMMPALYPGDYFIGVRYIPLRRQSIIVLDDPRDSEQKLLKRIIGIPGDAVQMRHGYIFVNDIALSEPYISDAYRSQETDPVYGPIKIPPEYYYVLGDNRNFSRDSRNFGLICRTAIHEQAIAVISPWENRKIFWSY